jgi:hypothetical protein
MALINMYSFKYMRPDQKVYPIVKVQADQLAFSKIQYMSVPFKHKDNLSNVLVSYICPKQAEIHAKRTDSSVIEIPVAEFTYIGNVLNMNSIVIMNSFCNTEDKDMHYELFYNLKQPIPTLRGSAPA